MIVKNVLRRHERWYPVQPTMGAFWGVGIGIGCGIGWGPGFGHEVVGYVGAGCGAGFNVGITLLGAGIGFPANYLYTPHTGFEIGGLKQNLADVRSMLDSHAKHMIDGLRRGGGEGLFPWDRGVSRN